MKQPTRRKIILETCIGKSECREFGGLPAAVLRTPRFNKHNPFGIRTPLKQRASNALMWCFSRRRFQCFMTWSQKPTKKRHHPFHPTKNVSIGIDPYPFQFEPTTAAGFTASQARLTQHLKASRAFTGAENFMVTQFRHVQTLPSKKSVKVLGQHHHPTFLYLFGM